MKNTNLNGTNGINENMKKEITMTRINQISAADYSEVYEIDGNIFTAKRTYIADGTVAEITLLQDDEIIAIGEFDMAGAGYDPETGDHPEESTDWGAYEAQILELHDAVVADPITMTDSDAYGEIYQTKRNQYMVARMDEYHPENFDLYRWIGDEAPTGREWLPGNDGNYALIDSDTYEIDPSEATDAEWDAYRERIEDLIYYHDSKN